MNRTAVKLGLMVCLILAVIFVLKRPSNRSDKGGSNPVAPVSTPRSKPWGGAYNAGPPMTALPDVLPSQRFASDPESECAYRLAAKIKPILYQMPCGCACDRELGHKSLFDCFRTRHGQECEICRREAIYTYVRQSRGAPPEQIREEIVEGMWQGVNVSEACLQNPPKSLRKTVR